MKIGNVIYYSLTRFFLPYFVLVSLLLVFQIAPPMKLSSEHEYHILISGMLIGAFVIISCRIINLCLDYFFCREKAKRQ